MPKSVVGFLHAWKGVGMLWRSRSKWDMIPHALWWTYGARGIENNFENVENSSLHVRTLFLNFIFWQHEVYSIAVVSFMNFLGEFSIIRVLC